jgi:putative ABC transport system permease protein
MLKHYLKTSFRSFRKNKFYSSLNIAGLAIALATCLMIVLYVYDELSYDKFNTNADRIYRVNNDIKIGNIQLDVAQTPPLLGPEAVKLLPAVEQYTRLRRRGNLLVKKGNSYLREERVV